MSRLSILLLASAAQIVTGRSVAAQSERLHGVLRQ